MDWQMPGINGVEATTRVVAEHAHLRSSATRRPPSRETHQAFLDAGAVAVRQGQVLAPRDWLGALVAG